MRSRRLVASLAGALAIALATPMAMAQPGGTDAPPDDTTQPAPATASGPPPRIPKPPNTNARPLTAEEQQVLDDVEEMFRRYADAANEHHERMRTLLLGEFERRKRDLEKRYAERIEETEKQRRRRHLESIALLEKFIADHPDHEEFTPDAMFRLANLYIDEAEYQLELAEEADDPELTPIADYSKSINLWRTIIDKFPEYRQLAGTLYLLAYYNKANDERRSLQLYLALVCSNKYDPKGEVKPEPTREEAIELANAPLLRDPYADCVPMDTADLALQQHAWVRGIGDYQFNVPGEMDETISAYGKVVADPTSDLYSEALYKLAWSYYRRDRLLEAINHFDASVSLYDKTVAAGEIPSLELREEALQYIAVSFTDPWNDEIDSEPAVAYQRAIEYYKDREDEPHVRDVWEQMGRAFLELQAWDQAVDAFSKAIGEPWHLHPNNPVLHQEIVDALESKGDNIAADEAMAELATRYAPGTEWYTANEKNREAMENQRRIAERMLYSAARNMHNAARQARQDWVAIGDETDLEGKKEWLALYGRAVALYQNFLDQYPASDHIYAFTYYMAEAMFFGEKYEESIEHYKWVRDHKDLSTKWFEPAAQSVIDAYQQLVNIEVEANRLDPLVVPELKELREIVAGMSPPYEKTIPKPYLDLQKAWDEYQELINEPQTAPQMGLNAALVSVAYFHFDDAIVRFEKVMDKFCKDGVPEVGAARDGLVAVYNALDDDDKFQEVNQRFIDQQCGSTEELELARSQNRSIEFRKAGKLLQRAKDEKNKDLYLQAAEEFWKYYKTAPVNDPDLPTALYNAAVATLKADKAKTSTALFKEFTDNKADLFRKNQYYLEALRLTAKAQRANHDYTAARKTYATLYTEAKAGKAKGLTPPKDINDNPQNFDVIKLDALYNIAAMYRMERDFANAIKYYKKYEAEEPDKQKKADALWEVALLYKTRGDLRNMRDTYATWRTRYGSMATHKDKYVYTYYDLAITYKKKGRTRESNTYKKQTVTAWEKMGSIESGDGARWAGEFALEIAETHFRGTWTKYKVKKTRTKKQGQAEVTRIDKALATVQDMYKDLVKYGVPEYTMAWRVRQGETWMMYGAKLFAMPIPSDIMKINDRNPEAGILELWDNELKKILDPVPGKAKADWSWVVDQAKKNGISNKWSQLALEKLSQEFPTEWSVLHQELYEGTDQP